MFQSYPQIICPLWNFNPFSRPSPICPALCSYNVPGTCTPSFVTLYYDYPFASLSGLPCTRTSSGAWTVYFAFYLQPLYNIYMWLMLHLSGLNKWEALNQFLIYSFQESHQFVNNNNNNKNALPKTKSNVCMQREVGAMDVFRKGS